MVKIDIQEHIPTEPKETEEEQFERLMKESGLTPGQPTKFFPYTDDKTVNGQTSSQIHIKGY